MIITITGLSGCGKSTLARMIEDKLELLLIDVDEIVKNMYSDKIIQDKLLTAFGKGILNIDNQVDKSKVSQIVMNSQEAWDKLNLLTWDYIENEIDKMLINSNNNAIIDYMFMPKTKYFKMSDINILVSPIDINKRIKNVLSRDNISKDKLMKRDAFAPKFDEYKFNYIIENDYTDNFINECNELAEELRGKL